MYVRIFYSPSAQHFSADQSTRVLIPKRPERGGAGRARGTGQEAAAGPTGNIPLEHIFPGADSRGKELI